MIQRLLHYSQLAVDTSYAVVSLCSSDGDVETTHQRTGHGSMKLLVQGSWQLGHCFESLIVYAYNAYKGTLGRRPPILYIEARHSQPYEARREWKHSAQLSSAGGAVLQDVAEHRGRQLAAAQAENCNSCKHACRFDISKDGYEHMPWMFKDIAAARHGSHLAVTTVAAAGPLGFCSSTTPVAVTLAFPRSLSLARAAVLSYYFVFILH